MKVVCDGLNLGLAASNVAKAINSKSNAPILEGIYIKACEDYLLLSATDLEISIEQKIPAEVMVQGEVVVMGSFFIKLIKKLTNEQIELSLINNNSLKITYGDSEGVIQCMPVEEFPKIEKPEFSESISMLQGELKELINKTVFCSANDDSRPILKGVLFEIDDFKVTAVALDGYRLALVSKAIEETTTKTNIIIPARSLKEIAMLLNNEDQVVVINIEKNRIMVNVDNITIISRLLEGEFILYKNIIPADFSTSVNFEREQFIDSIERASVMLNENKNNIITFDIDEKSCNIKTNSEYGNVNEKLNTTLIGKEIIITFNPRYILEALKAIKEDYITLKINSSTSPSIIEPLNEKDSKFMVLPIRLS